MPNLREKIATYFSKSELQNLCYDLSIDYDELPGDTLSDKVRSLITYCQRRNQSQSLLSRLKQLRPNVSWEIESLNVKPTTEVPPLVKRYFFVGHVYDKKLIDDLRDAISRATEGTPWQPIYADEEVVSGHILFDKITPLIADCEFSLFEISNQTRPNVFIELGIALQQGKPVYLLMEHGTEPPSDLAGRDRITYRSYKELTESLREKVFSKNPTVLARKLLRHTYHVNSISARSDLGVLGSGSGDRNAILWNIESGDVQAIFKHESWVGSVAFAPHLPVLATSDGKGNIRFWDIDQSKLIRMWQAHEGACRTIAFSPNGKLLASGGGDDQIHIWKVSNFELIMALTGHSLEVRRVSWAPDGNNLVSCGEDGNLFLWSLNSEQYQPLLRNPNNLMRSVAYADNGKLIVAVDSAGTLWIAQQVNSLKWNVESIRGAHEGPVIGLCIHPNSQTIVTGGQDKLIRFWDLRNKKCFKKIKEHTDSVTCLSFAFNGKWLISGSRDKSICLWEV